MRIVAGRLRGKALRAPSDRSVRPTSDRAREAVFNLLAHGKAALDLDGLHVLDLFCGSGALGLEALSRGAAFAAFIDVSPPSLQLARQNAAACGVGDAIATLKLDASRLPPPARLLRAPFGLVFLDAPYGQGLTLPALKGLLGRGWLADGAHLVVELAADELLEAPRDFAVLDERTYGAAKVLFLRAPGG